MLLLWVLLGLRGFGASACPLACRLSGTPKESTEAHGAKSALFGVLGLKVGLCRIGLKLTLRVGLRRLRPAILRPFDHLWSSSAACCPLGSSFPSKASSSVWDCLGRLGFPASLRCSRARCAHPKIQALEPPKALRLVRPRLQGES